MDLVSYNEKHNEANGEKGRDGTNDIFSWNCGHEVPTDDDAIQAMRWRQMKNFHLVLMMSQGTPMIVAGVATLCSLWFDSDARPVTHKHFVQPALLFVSAWFLLYVHEVRLQVMIMV